MSKQQIQNSPGTISPSLEAKLRRCADALTPAEQAQVRALQTDDVTGMLSPSLETKLRQCADALTTEETAQVALLLQHPGVAATPDDMEGS